MVAARPLTLDASAPQWARRLVNDLEGAYVKAVPSRPQLLTQLTQSTLPPAADYPWCIVALTDLTCVAMSTGSAWVRADGSAL